jgi:hypothetical protein
MERPYTLSCHCGNIRFQVDAELTNLGEGNCSTCRRFGVISWKVPRAAVKDLLVQRRGLSTYAWQCLRALWHFCPTCGTTLLLTGYADGTIMVNARCIEYVDVFELKVTRGDCRHALPPGADVP